MRTYDHPTRHEPADPCCAEHVARLSEKLAEWSQRIIEAEAQARKRPFSESDRWGIVEAYVASAANEVSEILETPCERLRSSQGVDGEATQDASQVDFVNVLLIE